MSLHHIGDDAYDLYTSLPDPASSSSDNEYDKAKLKLSNYFKPKINVEFEIYNFRQAKQLHGETLDQYYARLLKLFKNCNFDDHKKEIKSQIILSTNSTRIRRIALSEQLTLEELLAKGKTFETTDHQLMAIEQKETVNFSKTSKESRKDRKDNGYFKHNKQEKSKCQTRNFESVKENKTEKICRNCGNNWHNQDPKLTCPARNAQCRGCGKKGHFQKLCITTGMMKIPSKQQTRAIMNNQPEIELLKDNESSSEEAFRII
nr:uncharacterized protein LOC111515762 [Leptinotarsa decemlineata]